MSLHLSQDSGAQEGLKRFECTVPKCTKHFSRKEHLTRHLKSHDPNLQYGCHICGRRYARSDVLKRHIESHPLPPQPSSFSDKPPLQGSSRTEAPKYQADKRVSNETLEGTLPPVVARKPNGFPEVSGLQPTILLKSGRLPDEIISYSANRSMQGGPKTPRDKLTRMAVWKAAQFSRNASNDAVKAKLGTGGPLNPLVISGLLMSAIVVISYAFHTRACPFCTGRDPVDVVHIFSSDLQCDRFVRWKEDGTGLLNWGDDIFKIMPVCKCSIAGLEGWFFDLLEHDLDSKEEFIAFLAVLKSA